MHGASTRESCQRRCSALARCSESQFKREPGATRLLLFDSCLGRSSGQKMTGDDDIVERALLRLLRPELVKPQAETTLRKRVRRKSGLLTRSHAEAGPSIQPARILILEILSTRTLSVFWSDSQTGHYAEQTWRLGLARTDGLCVISGRPIAAGEEVFRPRRSVTYAPANWNQMILKSVVLEGAVLRKHTGHRQK
jgi:hypothetical protein